MWGLYLCCVPERRRCSRARTFDFNGCLVVAVEHLRRSGSILPRAPQVQSAVALLNLGIKKVEPLRGSEFCTNFAKATFRVPTQKVLGCTSEEPNLVQGEC